MDWILSHLVQVITAAFVIVSVIKGLRQSSRPGEGRPATETGEGEEQRRVREIQERIRRKIAERRGGHPSSEREPAALGNELPPPLRPQRAPAPLHPFGETVKRTLQELERKLQPPPARPVPTPTANRVELERQYRLAEELRVADDVRLQVARRAAHQANAKAEAAETPTALLTATRQRLLSDLRDPNSLRRVILLREVLGPPVALR